ncbi:MAG: hypothetical protein NT106_09530 [Candidatus Sumerlaeota bacterium]|nr:hypothetical protein [Candidatus Sumerlaeota bacterium]
MIKWNVSHLVWGVALMMLLAVGATSEPVRIDGASIGARGNAEILRIHLDCAPAAGETPVYQDHLFHQAGYGYIEFPGAVLAGEERVLKYDGVFLESVRLKREEGSPAPSPELWSVGDSSSIRVYFYFKKLASYTIEQEAGEIRVVFSEKPERHSAIPPDADMYFSISSSANPASSPAPAPDSLDRVVDAVNVKSPTLHSSGDGAEKPLILAQAKQTETKVPPPGFFVPPINKETALKPSNAVLPEEDVFAQLVTLRFKDADLQNVIRMIAQKTGLNIIMSRNVVTGIITLDLEDVPLGNALDAILKTQDMAFVKEPGGIVRIILRKDIEEETKTYHVPVNWVPASKLTETLRPFLTKAPKAQIQPDNDSNSIIITDTSENLNTLLDLVGKLDVPEKQVMIEMRLVDISKELLREIGMNWSLSETQQYTGGKPITQTTTTLNPITGQVEKVVETITGYTPKVPKYDVPDTFNSATNTAAGLGSNLTWGRMVSIFGQGFDFDAFVNANQNKSLIRVLSNPRVITLNNVPAKIEIINEIPYLNSLAGSGGSVTVQAEFKESGITMEVTPYVTNNGYVRMKVKPDQKIYRGPDKITHILPQIDRRSAETNVIVRDEETVLLGGLRQATDTDATLGTPWFMDIPVIGWFFKSNSTVNNKLEMVMFVTPHIIKEPALSELEKTQYEQIDYGWDLPAEFFKSKKEMPAAKK